MDWNVSGSNEAEKGHEGEFFLYCPSDTRGLPEFRCRGFATLGHVRCLPPCVGEGTLAGVHSALWVIDRVMNPLRYFFMHPMALSQTHFHLTGFPLLFVLLIGGMALPFLLMGIAQVVQFKSPTALKYTTYESGMPTFGDAHIQFDVKFYLYALLFILFDIETAFLFPWAITFDSLGVRGLVIMYLFVDILLLGVIYAWRKGALRWQ